MDTSDRPKLRLLETQSHDEGGQSGILLTDPDGLFEGQVFVPRGLLPVLVCFNGESTIEAIAAELSEQSGQKVSADDVLKIAEDLESRLCLEGERADRIRERQRAAFLGMSARPAAHVGSGYPAEQAECADYLDQILGDDEQRDSRLVRGLIAPHIDLRRGRLGYRAAYQVIRSSPPSDLYVLFGTAHNCPEEAILVPTTKHFETPLGRVDTDSDFVGEVAGALGGDPFADEMLHLREHSLEFQVLFLKHSLRDRTFRIAPFLTGQLPDEPANCMRTQRIVSAILDAIGRRKDCRVTFVGGADMAHLGPWFGDDDDVTDELLEDVDSRDRQSLELLVQHRVEEFHDHVEGDGNTRRICGTAPMYFVGRLARELDGECATELLDYGQAVAPDRSQVVTFASVAYRSA